MFEIICKRSGPLQVKRGKCQLFFTVAESVCTEGCLGGTKDWSYMHTHRESQCNKNEKAARPVTSFQDCNCDYSSQFQSSVFSVAALIDECVQACWPRPLHVGAD